MIRIARYVTLAVISLFLLSTASGATTYRMPPQPDWPDSSWTVGSSITYGVKIDQGEESTSLDFRIAILDTVIENNTTLYRVEFDITGMTGLPADAQNFFLSNYGELPNAIRLRMLIPYYDLLSMTTDPSKFYYDFTDPEFVRSLIFQYNRQIPLDVDPALIGGFILPIFASELMGDDLPEDFISNRNLGIEFIEDAENFTTELGESEITVEAGEFAGWLYSITSGSENGGTGTIFFTDETPILPIVMYSGNWISDGGSGNVELELINIEASDAATEIVGDPARFDLQTLMYGM